MEVEEVSPMEGGESPVHIIEPQVELSEDLDHSSLEPSVELNENVVEPQVEFEEGAEHSEGNIYPFNSFAVEFYEGADAAADSSNANYPENEAASQDFHDGSALLNGDSLSNSASLDADEMSMDTSNSEAIDSTFKEDDTNYNEVQRTYLKDFFSSSASPSVDETSNPSYERIPLSRFPSIVKVVERAEYETIQTLYQLLYQRSAWDTQEILSKRILEFSGFTFSKSSEEFYNREMMLQTLQNTVLVKIGAILCLDQVRNVLSNVGLGRHDLINAIMEFLALPKKKTRASRISNNTSDSKSRAQNVEPCGCRNNCLTKFSEAEREILAKHHASLKKKQADAYFLSLIQVQQATKRPDDDAKKHRDYKYNYKVKIGRKNVGVCKGGFMMLHNVKMSRLNHLQLRLKSNNFPKALIAAVEYPYIEGQEDVVEEPPKTEEAAVEVTVDSTAPTTETTKENLTVDEIKKSISKKVPAVVVEKIDPVKITPQKKKNSKDDTKDKSTAGDPNRNDNVKKKLRDFPLVVKSLDEASETLLIDLHFLLFSTSADSEKVKENILNFDGFSFVKDCEEYDERNESLQRMSGKLITDVAKAFSLGVTSKREETIQNILSFLMKPDESYLENTTAAVPVILSDVELDDIDGFSDSDESITCEVVEKKVECIDLLSSGEDSDKEDGKKKSPVKKMKATTKPNVTIAPKPAPTPTPTPTPVVQTTSVPVSSNATTSQPVGSTPEPSKTTPGVIRKLKDFETIRKIVNTHPPEYLIDIYELLFLRKHDPGTLREEILDFSGFTFEKGSQEYVKRKQVLDRMLYNNVRRVYNTLIHNSTEVKVFSKPTMINEIFQFLFKLPDHDTSVRPLPPGAKTLMPKQPTTVPVAKINQIKPTPVANAPPTSAPASILPSQTGKLSDLKRVFQRVACFPCEYLVDVHKLLFMTDCDPKVIRQNIFGFKGFNFSVDSTEFQQRKMYLEYLTFHSLRKISSVLTTRSVDLRNSTKHELASHLTDVLAEYCNSASNSGDSTKDTANTTKADTPTTTVENIVVTPVIEGIKSVSPAASSSSKSVSPKTSNNSLKISIVETRSISSPAVSTSKTSPNKGNRKRKSQTVRQIVSDKKVAHAPPAAQPSDFADIHLPEVEQYRQIYGTNLNVYPSVPTITGIASFGSGVPQTFSQLVPQAMTFPIVSPYPQTLQVSSMQQPSQMIGLQSTALTVTTPIISQVTSKAPEVIVPADIEQTAPESKTQTGTPTEKESPNKDKDAEEDGDQPLASLIGHPTDAVLKKHISDIVDKTDLQDITMNGVIQRIYDMYPKFDLSYRKEFIKSSLRTILYKLGEKSDSKEGSRDSNSPDCSVTTSDILDISLTESVESSA